MLSRATLLLLTLAGSCLAVIRFTTDRWEIVEGRGLVLTWTNAVGVVNIDMAEVTTEGLAKPSEVAKDYTGNNTFVWTPTADFNTGDYVFHIRDQWGVDESPRLSLSAISAHSLQKDKAPRDTSNSKGKGKGDDGIGPSTAAGIGVGSTLGGIFLLAMVAFLVYRGRQGKTRLRDQETGEQDLGKQKQTATKFHTYESHM